LPEVGSASNRYEILAKLAEGGMAEIFLARGASAGGIERHVVLKRILPQLANDTAFVQMFLDEARLAAQLQHPNVAQVYDVGRLGESYFFTMEYVHGETVRAMIKRGRAEKRPVPVASALAVAAGAAAGLHHAHTRKGAGGRSLDIVHRDVSPSNLMISYEGHVKLVDFGVAKAAGKMFQTGLGTVKGKIAYLAPEQCNSQSVDRRTDLFALGIVLWELLTGQYLYRRDTDYLTMTAICDEPVHPASVYRGDVPPELDRLLLRLLAKDPAARFQTGGEVVEAVETIAARMGVPVGASALARFMHEWFGERAEPWIEYDQVAAASIVTVQSDPLAAPNLAASTMVDEQLRKVPTLPPSAFDIEELRASLAASGHAAAGAHPAATLPTVAHRPPTAPVRHPTPVPVRQPTPVPVRHPTPVPEATYSRAPTPVPVRPPTAPVIVPTAAVRAPTAPVSVQMAPVRMTTQGQRATTPLPTAPRRRLLVWIVLLLVLAAAVGIALAVVPRGGSPREASAPRDTAHPTAPAAVGPAVAVPAAASGHAAASIPATPPLDAATPPVDAHAPDAPAHRHNTAGPDPCRADPMACMR
jgi:hypothetical protein